MSATAIDLSRITKGVRVMSKAAVTWLFAGAAVVVIVGSIIGVVAWATGIAGGGVTIGGSQLIAVNGASFAGVLVWLILGWGLVGIGALGGLAAWIAALLNTAQLEDRTWFLALLVLGLFSFGWVAMIAYVLAGPDSTRRDSARGPVAGAIPS